MFKGNVDFLDSQEDFRVGRIHSEDRPHKGMNLVQSGTDEDVLKFHHGSQNGKQCKSCELCFRKFFTSCFQIILDYGLAKLQKKSKKTTFSVPLPMSLDTLHLPMPES